MRLPLAPLPVREGYQRLFTAWAYREVDFTFPLGESPESGSASGEASA